MKEPRQLIIKEQLVFNPFKATMYKNHMRNCHSQEEDKESWQVNVNWYSEIDKITYKIQWSMNKTWALINDYESILVH